MKSYLIVCFFFYVAVVVLSKKSKKCTEQSECKEGQCCSGIPPFGGTCKSLTAAGRECHIEPKTVSMFGDFVIGPCPCVEGLKCVQKEEEENKGICQKPTAQKSTAKSKKSGSTESTEDTSVEESTEDKSDEKSSNDFSPDYKKFIEKFKFKGP